MDKKINNFNKLVLDLQKINKNLENTLAKAQKLEAELEKIKHSYYSSLN